MLNRSIRRLTVPGFVVAALAAMVFAFAPQSAQAGSRYCGSSRSGFSIGIGYSGGHTAIGFGYSSGYRGYGGYRGDCGPRYGVSYSYHAYPRYSYAPRYCAPVYVAPRYYGSCYPRYNVSYYSSYPVYSSYQTYPTYSSYPTTYDSYAQADNTVNVQPVATRVVTPAPTIYGQAQNDTRDITNPDASFGRTYPTSFRTYPSGETSSNEVAQGPDGWQLLASGDATGALAAFAAQAPKLPNMGYPKLGFAIASSMADDNDSAVFALRRAFEVDPSGMDNLPSNAGIVAQIKTMREKFVYQSGMKDAGTDPQFVVAALSYILHDYSFAAKSLAKAEAAGDTAESTRNLRKAIDAVVTVRPAQ